MPGKPRTGSPMSNVSRVGDVANALVPPLSPSPTTNEAPNITSV